VRPLALALVLAALVAGCGSSNSSSSSTNAISSSLRHKIIAGYVHAGATPPEATEVTDCVIRVLAKDGYVTASQIEAHSSVFDTETTRCKQKLGIP
jgi:hypothetical protein